MRTGLGFQPLEIIHLIPHILELGTILCGVAFWQRREPDLLAVLDDWPRCCLQVHINTLRVVHPELARRHYQNGVMHRGDVDWTSDMAADDERVVDVTESEACEWMAG